MKAATYVVWQREIGKKWKKTNLDGTIRFEVLDDAVTKLSRERFSGMIAILKHGEKPDLESNNWHAFAAGRLLPYKGVRQPEVNER